jgi:hypothetical protein
MCNEARNNILCCSCYNAFSRVDTRVVVKIPGGVECFVVDAQGTR